MALSKIATAQTPFPVATLLVGGGEVDGPWLPILHGVSIHATLTNGATPPITPAEFVVYGADDNVGTGAVELARYPQGNLSANGVSRWVTGFEPGSGDGGDWPFYRVSFVRPTGQEVTAQSRASATTWNN